jgi:hypothetical protein
MHDCCDGKTRIIVLIIITKKRIMSTPTKTSIMSTPNKKVTKTTTTMQVSSAMPGEQPGDAIIETIRHAVNKTAHHYVDTPESNNVYHVDDGYLVGNILCGCFLQYYAYDIHLGTPAWSLHYRVYRPVSWLVGWSDWSDQDE